MHVTALSSTESINCMVHSYTLYLNVIFGHSNCHMVISFLFILLIRSGGSLAQRSRGGLLKLRRNWQPHG